MFRKVEIELRRRGFAMSSSRQTTKLRQNMAPFIKHKVLRHIICSFTNGAEGNFDALASNPRVLDMLNQAKKVRSESNSTVSSQLKSDIRVLRFWTMEN